MPVVRRGEVGAHHQGVGEEADQWLELDATAVGDRRADQHRVLPRVAVKEGLEGGQQRHEDGDALAAGELADGGREFGVELERELAAPEPLDRRTGPVQGEVEQLGSVLELRAPVIELALKHVPGQPLALPDGVVGELQCGLGQRAALAAAEGGVERAEL